MNTSMNMNMSTNLCMTMGKQTNTQERKSSHIRIRSLLSVQAEFSERMRRAGGSEIIYLQGRATALNVAVSTGVIGRDADTKIMLTRK